MEGESCLFEIVTKGRSGYWILSFKENPTDLKEDQHFKRRHLLLGEVYKMCQTVVSLPLCSAELVLYPTWGDAHMHAADKQMLRCASQRRGLRTVHRCWTWRKWWRSQDSQAVSQKACWVCSPRLGDHLNYLWEKWEESIARRGGSWGNWVRDSHIPLTATDPLVGSRLNMMHMPCAMYGSMLCSLFAIVGCHIVSFQIH